MIKILDCTLRDGGYINNWKFSPQDVKDITDNLKKANIDFVEIGFFHHNLENIAPEDCSDIFAMVQYSKTNLSEIKPVDESKIKNLRIIFKKHESKDALKYCAAIKDKGYKIFTNITFCSQYEDYELIELIKKINKINPYAITITDSMGVYTPCDIKRINNIVEGELNENIALCFHSHNNLMLSYSNALTLMELNRKRDLIIDSTVFAMGRGAGNLNTELLIEYLNKRGGNYNLLPILEIIGKYIYPIYKKTPWGYSIPYYLSAIHKCHPDYAKFLIEKKAEYAKMDEIFSSIPCDKKAIYDGSLLQKLI